MPIQTFNKDVVRQKNGPYKQQIQHAIKEISFLFYSIVGAWRTDAISVGSFVLERRWEVFRCLPSATLPLGQSYTLHH